jgi:Flp pilus assembly pilin Flp
MNAIKRFYVRIRESSSGQTMTEYVLIVTAVAVGVYAGYQTFGTEVSTEVASINSQL